MREIPAISGEGTIPCYGTAKEGVMVYTSSDASIYLPPKCMRQLKKDFAGQSIPVTTDGDSPSLDQWLKALGFQREAAELLAAVVVEQGLAQVNDDGMLIFAE